MQSPHHSPSNDPDDDLNWHEHDDGSNPDTPLGAASSIEQPGKRSLPLHKRRRVTRACDECRRKKIKCDGKQPCTHCTVYSYECTYDQPSNRKRNPAPQIIEALEGRLNKAEAILRLVLPGIDLENPKFDAHGIDQIIESESKKSAAASGATRTPKSEDDAQVESMVANTGLLDLDDQGHWDFHGHSSGLAFMSKLRSQIGDVVLPPTKSPHERARNVPLIFDSPKSASSSPFDFHMPASLDLPSKEVAKELCQNALDDAIALMRFIHQPSFYQKFDRIFDTDPDQFTNADTRFLPLLYLALAIGCLFSSTENTVLISKGYEDAITRGYQYFQAGKHMLEITDCRDLTALHTVCFMIMFLQCTAKLSTCYSYLGVALRACCRLGLHRNIKADFNPIEREERKRTFWVIRRLDIYVSAMLGLPNMLSDDDIDQELPVEIDDEFVTAEGVHGMPAARFSLATASNAHTKLCWILQKVVKHIYPIKNFKLPEQNHPGDGYSVSHSRIRQIERDLQTWKDALPMELRPTDEASKDLARVQQLLRLSYAHIQMVLYRPFLHYVSQNRRPKHVDRRSFECAAACVSVARNIVDITSEMKRRGLLIGAYWFVMYTTYLAILALVFFAVENPESPTGKEILKGAMEGRDTLAALARRSLAADRCSQSLVSVFNGLPERLKERKDSLSASDPPHPSKKRPIGSSDMVGKHGDKSAPNSTAVSGPERDFRSPSRASTFPHNMSGTSSKRMSMPEAARLAPSAFEHPLARSQQPTPWEIGNPASTVAPTGPAAAYQGQDLGNPNLPDLNTVMFPSDNPFAYPNQPMSTLEAQQFISPAQPSAYSSPTSSGIYDMSGPSTQVPPRSSFDGSEHAMYGTMPSFAQQYLGLGQQINPAAGNVVPFGASQQPPTGGDPAGINFRGNDAYWPQLERVDGGRTGLTAGGVNLDELFGGESWSNVWSH